MREVIEERVRELAEEHPRYGYRKIWALARQQGLKGSLSTVYRVLKGAGLLLEPSYRQELWKNSRARKRYLHRPTEPNEPWQVHLTQVPISDYGVYWVTSVVDYSIENNDHLTIDAALGENAALLVKMTYHSGWRAYSNGNQLPIEPDPLGFMVIKPEMQGE